MTTQVETEDLEHILNHTSHLWEEIKKRKIFITGGTGFFGCWLLESFIRANDQLGLKAKAVVLSRSPQAFATKAPHLAKHPAIELVSGDVRTFDFPQGDFDLVIHGATESSTQLNKEDPTLMLGTIIEGTHRVLEFAHTHGTSKFLMISSGAVYGKQPTGMSHIPEDYTGAPDTMETSSAYGEGKRAAEFLCRTYAQRFGLEIKIARGFAFAGPYLPMDAHFAIGNFIRDAYKGGPVIVKGDGTPFRSYLYAADLAIWLWTILIKGRSCHPYNVGSDRNISIADLAKLVCQLTAPNIKFNIAQKADPAKQPERYVPSINRAKLELKLDVWFPLEKGIEKTLRWIKQ